jgi:hypothetical protein
MSRAFTGIGLVLMTLATGCLAEVAGGDDGEAARGDEALSGDQTTGPLPADSDLSEPPTASIFFTPDWGESTYGVLYQGASVSVSLDPSRFPTCGTDGTVFAGTTTEDGLVTETVLDGGTPGDARWGTVELPPSGRELQVWLRVEGDDGCVEYDSEFGRNYRFALHAWRPVRVRFGDDWSETVEGTLEPGGVLVVDYDIDRLPWCRVIYRGWPGWEILAHVRFDAGGPVPAQSVTRLNGMYSSDMLRVLAVFPIPDDAHHAELWFENDQYPPTCQAWDSDFGNNYHFWF